MSTAVSPEGAPTPETPSGRAPRGSLLRAELTRFWSRQFILAVLVLGVAGLVIGTAVSLTQYEKVSPLELAEAQAELERQRALDLAAFEQCLADPPADLPDDATPEQWCGDPSQFEYDVAWFLDGQPFVLADELPAGVQGIGVATAAALFLIGATYVGAEWSSRSMVALLFWEPRRLTVMGTKALVTGLAAAVVAVVAQLAWVAAAHLLAALRGTSELPAGFWDDVLAQQGRVVGLGVLAALFGFAIAHLMRNTGAALGVGFVYFAVVELAVFGLRPQWSQYLVSQNIAGFVVPGGTEISIWDEARAQDRILEISNLRGGLTLTAYCAALLLVGAWSFRQRDLH